MLPASSVSSNIAIDSSVLYCGSIEDRGSPMISRAHGTSKTSMVGKDRVHDLRGHILPIPRNQAYEDEEISLGQTYVDSAMSVIDAGGTSPCFEMETAQIGRGAVIEFSKHRYWLQWIVEGLKDFVHILTPDGRILYMSESAKELIGYSPEELTGKFFVDFIHPDDVATFVRELNDSIASRGPLRLFYRFRRQTGEYGIFEAHGHPHVAHKAASYDLNSSPALCNGVFIIGRPYPGRNSALLDSFLEQKIENERLVKKIDALRREEEEEQDEYHRYWKKEGSLEHHLADEPKVSLMGQPTSSEVPTLPPLAEPRAINSKFSFQSYEEVDPVSKLDSLGQKMGHNVGTAHVETIEMLTGLRYRDGERSQGISTGDASPALIHGGLGTTIWRDKEGRIGDKKKRIKIADEYICTDCGTLDSPEWRKGPEGPKTLCNACGLRWAKQEKKKTGSSFSNGAEPCIYNPTSGSSRLNTGSTM